MNILAIDAATKTSGYAYFKNTELIKSGTFSAYSKNRVARIDKIIKDILNFLENNEVDKIVLEDVLADIKSDKSNDEKRLVTYQTLTWLHGVLNVELYKKFPNIEVIYKLPSEWRSEIGIKTGAGIKRQELKLRAFEVVKDKFGLDIESDDEAEAICIGYSETKNIRLW